MCWEAPCGGPSICPPILGGPPMGGPPIGGPPIGGPPIGGPPIGGPPIGGPPIGGPPKPPPGGGGGGSATCLQLQLSSLSSQNFRIHSSLGNLLASHGIILRDILLLLLLAFRNGMLILHSNTSILTVQPTTFWDPPCHVPSIDLSLCCSRSPLVFAPSQFAPKSGRSDSVYRVSTFWGQLSTSTVRSSPLPSALPCLRALNKETWEIPPHTKKKTLLPEVSDWKQGLSKAQHSLAKLQQTASRHLWLWHHAPTPPRPFPCRHWQRDRFPLSQRNPSDQGVLVGPGQNAKRRVASRATCGSTGTRKESLEFVLMQQFWITSKKAIPGSRYVNWKIKKQRKSFPWSIVSFFCVGSYDYGMLLLLHGTTTDGVWDLSVKLN